MERRSILTASTVFDLAKKNEELAAAAYVKLSGRKQPEAIVNEGSGVYSHTSSRGKKMILKPCISFNEYKKESSKHPGCKMKKCLGYYVIEIR